MRHLRELFVVELLTAVWRELRCGFRRHPMRDAWGYAISAEKLRRR